MARKRCRTREYAQVVYLTLLLVLAGCAQQAAVCPPPPKPEVVHEIETQRVEVPVPVRPTPPAELMQAYRPETLPEWASPGATNGSSSLTPEGEKALRRIVYDLLARDRAWREWAKEAP